MNKLGTHFGFWERNIGVIDTELGIKCIKRAAKIGFDVLEFAAAPFYDMNKSDMDKLKNAAQAHNIEFAYSYCFTPEQDVSPGDAAKRKRGIAFMQQVLKNVGYMNGTNMGGITYGTWHGIIEDSKQAHWERAVESVKEIIKVAEDYGITYLLETVNRFENFILNTHEESLRFANDVGNPVVKVELDSFHMNIEEDDFEAAIVKTGDMLGHFHVGECNRKPPGTGRLDWDVIFAALCKIDYQGWIVMEPFVLSGGDVSKDVALYRELMPGADLDVEAEKALKFMKEKLIKYGK